jgi:hypothetical protein
VKTVICVHFWHKKPLIHGENKMYTSLYRATRDRVVCEPLPFFLLSVLLRTATHSSPPVPLLAHTTSPSSGALPRRLAAPRLW